MADTIEETIETLVSAETLMNNDKARVAPFAYDNNAYTNETEAGIYGVSEYSYANNQNIPLGDHETLETNSTTLSKGLRAQASSLSRQLVNHFFGRVSFNLNKIHEWFSRFLEKYRTDLRQNANRWSAVSAYELGDVCFMLSVVDDRSVARFFRCINSSATGLVNYPPIKGDGTVDTEHWQECNVFDELTALRFHGEATDVADGSITTSKIADGAVTKSKLAEGATGIYRATVQVHGIETVIPLSIFPDFKYDSEAHYCAFALPRPADRTFLVSTCTVDSQGIHIFPHYIEDGVVKAGTGFSQFTFGSSLLFGSEDGEGDAITFGQEDITHDTVEMTVVMF